MTPSTSLLVRRLLGLLLGLLLAGGAAAGDTGRQILVTFADPGMSRSSAGGPVGPGYRRGSASYLVAINVRRTARRIESEFDLEPVDEWPITSLKVHCVVYAVAATRDVDALLDALRDQPDIDSAQAMNSFEVLGADNADGGDPYAGLQHSLDRLELAAAHRWSRGEGSRVAIIDTGADTAHPELNTQIVAKVDFAGHFAGDRQRDFDSDAHGTAVAGVIGASTDNGVGIVGVAPRAAMSVLRACWYTAERDAAVCNSFTLAKALSHAIDSSAQVINMSLAGPADPLLSRLIVTALGKGKIIVAAAPRPDARHAFPATIDGVIVVDATDDDAIAADDRAIYAPGDDILVPVPGGKFDFASGSSLSAAHVSGIVALLLSRRPDLTHRETIRLLTGAGSTPGTSVSACRSLERLLGENGDCGSSGKVASRSDPELPVTGRSEGD